MEPFDLRLVRKAQTGQIQFSPPFEVVRSEAAWVMLGHRPELRLTIVFNKAPDMASLQRGLSVVGGPTNQPFWTPRSLRTTDDVTVVQFAPGPDQYARTVAYDARLRLDGVVLSPDAPRNPFPANNRIDDHDAAIRIPAAPRFTARVTDWEHRISGQQSVLTWTCNTPMSEVSIDGALRVDGRAPANAARAYETGLYYGAYRYTVTLPALAPGRHTIALEGARTENWNAELRRSLNHQHVVDIRAQAAAGTREDRRSYGSNSFGVELLSWLRTDRRNASGRVEMSAEVGHRTTGKLFGERFRAVDATATSSATYVSSTRVLTGRARASVTFGQGALSFTWTPVDNDLSVRPAFDQSLRRDIFSHSTTVPVGPIPVTLSAGARITLRVDGRVELFHQAQPVQDSGIRGTARLSGALSGWVRAGVGISFMGVEVGVGIEADLTLAQPGLAGTILVTLRRIDCWVDFTFRSSLELAIVASVHVPLPWPLPDIDIEKRKDLIDPIVLQPAAIRLFRIQL